MTQICLLRGSQRCGTLNEQNSATLYTEAALDEICSQIRDIPDKVETAHRGDANTMFPVLSS